ncbi:hypothetical protein PHAVU_001G056700 [Phaseolus vulgaris]|uniref:Uncharacterized protein n=1 Tax=Phaseolus vulgaris TaxID=3885 RepID=V7CVH8_PHAVU|nr:hypothetical protein PHAVU_001G056700g [Phaseolus vulgaris]ESW33270.1 hypothetical protein PHAVU_001G056700g [Phaseolus vulgaris]
MEEGRKNLFRRRLPHDSHSIIKDNMEKNSASPPDKSKIALNLNKNNLKILSSKWRNRVSNMVVNLTCELVQLDEFTGLKPSICLTCNQTRFCVGPSKLKG